MNNPHNSILAAFAGIAEKPNYSIQFYRGKHWLLKADTSEAAGFLTGSVCEDAADYCNSVDAQTASEWFKTLANTQRNEVLKIN